MENPILSIYQIIELAEKDEEVFCIKNQKNIKADYLLNWSVRNLNRSIKYKNFYFKKENYGS